MKMSDDTMKITREALDAIPDKYLATILDILAGMNNGTNMDLLEPRIRTSVANIYPLFIAMYAVLGVTGIVANFVMFYHIVYKKLYRDATYAYLINIAISNVIKCAFALPITLAHLLVRNWIFGKFMCYFLPILQDMPIHISMMTFLLIAIDRYRLVTAPGQFRVPAAVLSVGSWFFGVCIVLPHPIYTTYLDLESLMKEDFQGVGICIVNLVDNIQAYTRGIFLLTFITPLTLISYLYVKANRELERLEEPLAAAMYEARRKRSHSRHGSSGTNSDDSSIRREKRGSNSIPSGGPVIPRSYDVYDAELDVLKEKRNQKYLIQMVSAFGILFCPLMVLNFTISLFLAFIMHYWLPVLMTVFCGFPCSRLAKLATVETYANAGIFDIIYTILVWLGFTSTVTTPIIYTFWKMSRAAKDRFRAHFRFNRGSLKAPDIEVAMTEIQVSRQGTSISNDACTQTTLIGNLASGSRISRGAISNPKVHRLVSHDAKSYRENLV